MFNNPELVKNLLNKHPPEEPFDDGYNADESEGSIEGTGEYDDNSLFDGDKVYNEQPPFDFVEGSESPASEVEEVSEIMTPEIQKAKEIIDTACYVGAEGKLPPKFTLQGQICNNRMDAGGFTDFPINTKAAKLVLDQHPDMQKLARLFKLDRQSRENISDTVFISTVKDIPFDGGLTRLFQQQSKSISSGDPFNKALNRDLKTQLITLSCLQKPNPYLAESMENHGLSLEQLEDYLLPDGNLRPDINEHLQQKMEGIFRADGYTPFNLFILLPNDFDFMEIIREHPKTIHHLYEVALDNQISTLHPIKKWATSTGIAIQPAAKVVNLNPPVDVSPKPIFSSTGSYESGGEVIIVPQENN